MASARRRVVAWLLGLVSVAVLGGCGGGGSRQAGVTVTPRHGPFAGRCASRDCGPYGATLRWSIPAPRSGGYDVFLGGARLATVHGRSYTFGGMSCGTTFVLGVRSRSGAAPRLVSTRYATPSCDLGPINRRAPYFTADTGRAVVGETLRVDSGHWTDPSSMFDYEWEDCVTRAGQPPTTSRCRPIPGATSPTYRVRSSDVGHALAAVVIATDAAGSRSTVVVGACRRGESDALGQSRTAPPPAEPAGCSPISAAAARIAARERFCSNAFVTCGYVDPLTGDVGAPPSSRLMPVSSNCGCLPPGATWSHGTLEISGDGVVVRDVSVRGGVTISGRDDTLTSSLVTTGICPRACSNAEPIIVEPGARNAQITHVTAYGGSNGTMHNASDEPVRWDRDYSYGACTGALGWGDVDNSFIITDIPIASQDGAGECHAEPAYVPGCTRAACWRWAPSPWHGECPGDCSSPTDSYTSLRGDVLLNPQDQTAAVFLDNHAFDADGNFNVTVTRSFVAGGDYAIYGDQPGDASRNIVIADDRWSSMYFPGGGGYGPCLWNPAGTTLTGDLWDDDGRSVGRGCARPGR